MRLDLAHEVNMDAEAVRTILVLIYLFRGIYRRVRGFDNDGIEEHREKHDLFWIVMLILIGVLFLE